MDLAQEGSLEKILEREKATEEGRLDNEKVADWMKEIAQALSYVHSKQMVHCDLKPANVLLDEEGHVRVADFGHSRVLSESGGALGTLFFMAPEQAVPPNEGEPPQPDIRWDVYALGCTAYALLSRHVPHAEIEDRLEKTPGLKERLQLYRQAVESEPVPELWESTQHRVDRDLSSIVAKCMKTDPEERYQSVAEVLADLKARHENRPVSPLAGDKIYWIGKFFARYRLSASVTVAALLVALGALYLTTRNQRTQLQDTALNDVLRGREFLDKGDEASAGAYFAASNKILPTLLARGNAVLDKPPIPRWVFRHEGEVTTVAYSRDGKFLLTADAKSGIRLWDWQTGRPLGPFLKLKGDVTCAVFNPEGSKIALGDSNGQIRIWKVEGQKPLVRVMDQGREITCLSFSPNGRQVAAGCSDGMV
ncbi:MAG TPA: serine/threonine-protein kinase, partial [bacterium]|nr:serine/threonine-protein kinase [bacterium]